MIQDGGPEIEMVRNQPSVPTPTATNASQLKRACVVSQRQHAKVHEACCSASTAYLSIQAPYAHMVSGNSYGLRAP